MRGRSGGPPKRHATGCGAGSVQAKAARYGARALKTGPGRCPGTLSSMRSCRARERDGAGAGPGLERARLRGPGSRDRLQHRHAPDARTLRGVPAAAARAPEECLMTRPHALCTRPDSKSGSATTTCPPSRHVIPPPPPTSRPPARPHTARPLTMWLGGETMLPMASKCHPPNTTNARRGPRHSEQWQRNHATKCARRGLGKWARGGGGDACTLAMRG